MSLSNAYHPPMVTQMQLQFLLRLQTCSYKEKQNRGLECRKSSANNLNVQVYYHIVSTSS